MERVFQVYEYHISAPEMLLARLSRKKKNPMYCNEIRARFSC